MSTEQLSNKDFKRHLRYWRKAARVSQMELALNCELSTKHLNQLENGKTIPTRETVLKLTNSLKLSFKNTNGMLLAAGLSPEFKSTELNSDAMSFTRYAIERTIEQNNPYPALVTDPGGELIFLNEGALKTLGFLVSTEILSKYQNVYEMFFSEDGFKPFIKNWEETGSAILNHLQQEILAIPPGQKGYDLITRLERDNKLPENWREVVKEEEESSIFSFHFRKGEIDLRFFSTYTTFGTPRDIALQEIRIESFFPADEKTKKFCEGL